MHFSSGLWLVPFLAARISAAPAAARGGSEDANFGVAARAFDELTPSTHLEVALEKRGNVVTNDDGSVNIAALQANVAANAV